MIRFRNPGTQYSTQLQVIKQLYIALRNQEYFTLKDMAMVIANGRLLTAYGYAGKEALRLSNTEQESMNSALMNAKMYAEVFRMLGWVTPYSEKASYPLVFTFIGMHVALSNNDCLKLYEQCVLGINNPTQLTNNLRYNEKIRFFKCALRSFVDLGGIMYKHELCLGPMNIDDENENDYKRMIEYIKNLRGNYIFLKEEFEKLSSSLEMKPETVDNCTRLPIAFMKNCQWIEVVRDTSLYGKSLYCLKLTEHGLKTYMNIKDMYDLRLDQYNRLDRYTQNAMIRLGTYSMLERAGYDISSVKNLIINDKKQCEHIIGNRELLFSASQTIRRNQVEEALNFKMDVVNKVQYHTNTFNGNLKRQKSFENIQEWYLNVSEYVNKDILNTNEDKIFLQLVEKMVRNKMDSSSIVNELFAYYINATQEVFYPLIATLFKIMGFNCSFSRPGDNGARWDAIIKDTERSIPIEIKSPTEEEHISIKAIRQALENKIVLLSRKTYITKNDVTSLVVGYYMPNNRAEVVNLISYFKEVFGYKIGVIDFKTLLSVAISIIVDKKGFNKEQLYYLEGLVNANIRKNNR